jgi:hypothetical protein
MRLALAAALLALVPATAAADTDLGVVTHDTPVATFGGRAVWSAYDASDQRFHLMTWTAQGGVQAVPVDPAPTAFDADLGPGAVGAVLAVYSRSGRIHTYDFASGLERRLPVRGRRPSIFRARVAFVRGGAVRSADLDGKRPHVLLRRVPDQFDVADNWLAYTTSRPHGEGRDVRLRLRNLHSRDDRLVRRATSGLLSPVDVTAVGFERGNVLYAAKERGGSAGNRLWRYRPGRRSLKEVVGRANVLDGGMVGTSLFYLRADSEFQSTCENAELGGCHLVLSDPISF